jgi:FkbM family methyltransferase
MITDECIFTNDNNVSVKLLNHPFSNDLKRRNNHEVIFRRINTFLINQNIIQPDKNIIDLGAWIGDNSIPWAKNITGKVYAIDPSGSNIDFITKTSNLNELKNVVPLQFAISDKQELLSTNEDLHHCSFVYNNPGIHGRNKLMAVSLDFLHEQKLIDNIGYIHLDVEGMEYNILKGSERIIQTYRPVITFEQHLELDDYSVILTFLNERGYKVFLLDEVLPGCRPDCRNSFAFPNELYSSNMIDNIHDHIGKKVMIPK